MQNTTGHQVQFRTYKPYFLQYIIGELLILNEVQAWEITDQGKDIFKTRDIFEEIRYISAEKIGYIGVDDSSQENLII